MLIFQFEAFRMKTESSRQRATIKVHFIIPQRNHMETMFIYVYLG